MQETDLFVNYTFPSWLTYKSYLHENIHRTTFDLGMEVDFESETDKKIFLFRFGFKNACFFKG